MSDTAVEPSRAGGSWLSRLLVAFGFANVADGVSLVLLPIVTVSLTHSPIALGAVALARTLPWSLLATPVGVHADRSPLRVLMISANAVRCAIMVVLAGLLVLDHLPLALVIVAAGLIGVCEVYYDIAAQTALPRLVQREALEKANSRQTLLAESLHGMAGPALGGLIAGVGPAVALTGAAACYLVAGLLGLRLPPLRPDTTSHGRLRAEFLKGVRTVWSEPLLRVFLVMTGFGAVSFAGWQAMLSLFALGPGPVHLTSFEFGLVYSIGSVGGVLAAACMPALVSRVSRAALIVFARVLASVSLVLPFFFRTFLGCSVAITGYSIAVIVWNVVTVSYRQRSLPSSVLGRSNAAYRTVAWGLLPLGPAVAGLVSQAGGPAIGLLSMGGLSAVALVLLPAVLARRAMLDAQQPEKV
ncbi:MFS transporter [Nonomuraea sp. NPDC005692]|uniref:MFS transporter n=1 Tax=Nonomuraea sp. NPDC005692 TaxID=3157168 RepID=UPI0033F320D4